MSSCVLCHTQLHEWYVNDKRSRVVVVLWPSG